MSCDYKFCTIKYDGTNTITNACYYEGSGNPYVRTSKLSEEEIVISGQMTIENLRTILNDKLLEKGTPISQQTNTTACLITEDGNHVLNEDNNPLMSEQ